MIIGNCVSSFRFPGRFIGGATLSGERSNFNTSGSSRNMFAGEAGISSLNGIPIGYRPPYCWVIPTKSGGLASQRQISGSSEVLPVGAAAGLNAGSSIVGQGSISQADLGLIVQAVATILGSGAFATNPQLSGVLSAAATLQGQGSMNNPTLGAILDAVATLIGSGQISMSDIRSIASIGAVITVSASTDYAKPSDVINAQDQIIIEVKKALKKTEFLALK